MIEYHEPLPKTEKKENLNVTEHWIKFNPLTKDELCNTWRGLLLKSGCRCEISLRPFMRALK
jgi:hypothetical protein